MVRDVPASPISFAVQGEAGSQAQLGRRMAPQFDFGVDIAPPGSTGRSRRSSQASNLDDGRSPFSQPNQSNIRDLPHVEELAHVRPARRHYSMQNRKMKALTQGNLNEAASRKVSLASVQSGIARGGCKKINLSDVLEKDMLDI